MNLLCKYTIQVKSYFEFLASQIKRRAEECVATSNASRAGLYTTRDEILSAIKEIESFNLTRLEARHVERLHELDEEALNKVLFEKFCFVVDAKDVKFKKKNELGYLIVLDRYVTREELFYYKECLRYVNVDEAISYENYFFGFVAKNVK
jgi:hypothetical protein